MSEEASLNASKGDGNALTSVRAGILLLDEPTSGLDSYTASRLVSTLADMAHQGRTIVCTIHQPRSDIFQMFDDVVLLSKGL